MKPIFSGAVNLEINLLDHKKSKKLAFQNDLEQKYHLEEELATQLKLFDSRSLLYGIWSELEQAGQIPETREGATSALVENRMFIFGGFSR